MDTINEQKDKSVSSKPPLLPKPCLNIVPCGPSEHVIPQMVITSAEDGAEEIRDVPQVIPLPYVSTYETSPVEVIAKEEIDDGNLQTDIHRQPGHNENQTAAATPEVAQNKMESKHEDPVTHSAVQRPLIIESEKFTAQSKVSVEANEQSIPKCPTPPQPPPPTTMQRPLIFDGTSQATEHYDLPRESSFEECSLETSSVNKKDSGGDIVDDKLILNEENKISTPDTKPKSSSFSWMPSFPKLHASGKGEKHSAADSTRDNIRTEDDKKVQDVETAQPAKKDGLQNVKKFFDNLLHDTSTDNLPTEHQEDAANTPKKAHKDGKHGVMKLFSSSKQDSEAGGASKEAATTPHQSEPSKDMEISPSSKDSKYNIKKMFDSFKHDSTDKKENVSAKKEDSSGVEIKSDAHKTTKDSKSGMKKFFDSFKHDGANVGETKSTTASETTVVPSADWKDTTDQPEKTVSLKYGEKFRDHLIEGASASEPAKKSSLRQIPNVESQAPIQSSVKNQTKDKPAEVKESVKSKQGDGQHGVMKFFHSFKHEEPGTSKESSGKFHVKFLDRDHSLKRSLSFRESILLKDSVSEETAKAEKDGLFGVKKYFSSTKQEPHSSDQTEKSKSKKIKRSQSCKETLAEKESFHGIKSFFDSFSHKSSPKTSDVKITEEDHIYDTVGKPDKSITNKVLPTTSKVLPTTRKELPTTRKELPTTSKVLPTTSKELSTASKELPTVSRELPSASKELPTTGKVLPTTCKVLPTTSKGHSENISKEPSSARFDGKSKEEHSGMKKLFDSFCHKDQSPKSKIAKDEDGKEKTYEKIDISSSIPSASESTRILNNSKKETVTTNKKAEPCSSQSTDSGKPKDVPKIVLYFSSDNVKQDQPETKVTSSIQVIEPSTSAESKPSMFSTISDNFMAIKDKVMHSKDKKPETLVNHDKKSEEYDLKNAAIESNLTNCSTGTYRPLEATYVNDICRETDNKKGNTGVPSTSKALPNSESQNSSQPVASDHSNSNRPGFKILPTATPGTPDTLYDTCCMRIAVLLGKKALEIVSDQTKTPPKKPPKPSAEAIAKARADVVSKRLRELQSKNASIGESIPVGYDGIRFADDETESSCDYKDVENFDYIMDYELINRYKFDNKMDAFSDPSICSISSYYTADTVTLKDETFSDAPLETVSLGSNDSNLFHHLSSTPNKVDFYSLPSSVKSKDKKDQKLKSLDKKSNSSTLTPSKKVPPPLPPKPTALSRQRMSQSIASSTNQKDSVSQCINGLSLSPRLHSKFAKDAAATKNRPLLVAGLKGTEFTSLQTKSKDSKNKTIKERTFNTVLKNESLKKVSTISPVHPPLQSTKSSPPQFFDTLSEFSVAKKFSPQRPPLPANSNLPEEEKSKNKSAPPVPEKPKREGRISSPVTVQKRTVSPPRPPPPVITRSNVPPPRPPPPTLNLKITDNLTSESQIEINGISRSSPQSPEIFSTPPDSPLSDTHINIPENNSESCEKLSIKINLPSRSFVDVNERSNIESNQPQLKSDIESDFSCAFRAQFTPSPQKREIVIVHNAEIPKCKTPEFRDISEMTPTPPPRSNTEILSCKTPDLSDALISDIIPIPPPRANTQIPFCETPDLSDTLMSEIAPTPPPRGRRVRSRTVEIPPKETSVSPLRRSQSLSDMDIQKRTHLLNVQTTSDKPDLKHLYTSVNKDGKRNVSNGSQSPSQASRPLPAPPPPPRKFRSLDRKPKESKKESHVFETSEDVPIELDISHTDLTIKPPERKRKAEHRFHSLSTERKKVGSESETSKMPRSYSVPLRPDRRSRHADPEYDENANVAFPTVAEVHHSTVLLDECGNEILDASPMSNIPLHDTIDGRGSNQDGSVQPHPRRKKEGNPKEKSHSSWYAETHPSDDSWEIVDWDSTADAGKKMADMYPGRRIPLRRRSDPLAGRKPRKTSQFYVNVEQGTGLPLLDKETSPVHIDCSEKSVQTSLETLSHGIISRDEQNENSESSNDTDNLLNMVKTLQSELKTTLNRHKSLDDEENESSNAPTDSEKIDECGGSLLKTPSIQSSTSELWPLTSSEESEGEMSNNGSLNLSQIAVIRKKKKIFYIAQEIMTSEEVFVDTLKLLNVDFKAAVDAANKQRNAPVVPDDVLSQILNHLPQLQHLNENLFMELKDRIDNWEKTEKIADVIVKMGPFLKLYSWFIHDFESNLSLLEESKKKFPLFGQVIKEFEASPRCKRLALNHYMLKPIQRIPQYRLLLQGYLHHLSEDSPDYQDTVTALQIVSEVANHANDSMKQGDNAQKLISIQNSIMGHKEIIKPGRLFVKEGELMKLSRKGMQPRWFVLFNDLLLYLTPVQQGLYRINHELPLTGMKVAIPIQQDYQNEFSIISVTRSFTLASRSQEERQEWIVALTKAIEENASKRSTFTNIRLQQKVQDKNSEDDDGEFVLGGRAPVWIPDARVTMCQLCTSEFTVTFRRHHCRACGKVVCSICSSNRIPLTYLGGNKVNRVCDECYSKLAPDPGGCPESGETDSDNQQIAVKPHLRTEHRYVKKGKRNLPSVLKEVCANDQGSTISGYLQKRTGKNWKKQWFVVKDNVLYEYRASEDVAALKSIPLLGYQIESFSEAYENVDTSLLFQLAHPGQAPVIFHADSIGSTERWIAALKEATVLQ